MHMHAHMNMCTHEYSTHKKYTCTQIHMCTHTCTQAHTASGHMPGALPWIFLSFAGLTVKVLHLEGQDWQWLLLG